MDRVLLAVDENPGHDSQGCSPPRRKATPCRSTMCSRRGLSSNVRCPFCSWCSSRQPWGGGANLDHLLAHGEIAQIFSRLHRRESGTLPHVASVQVVARGEGIGQGNENAMEDLGETHARRGPLPLQGRFLARR